MVAELESNKESLKAVKDSLQGIENTHQLYVLHEIVYNISTLLIITGLSLALKEEAEQPENEAKEAHKKAWEGGIKICLFQYRICSRIIRLAYKPTR